MMWRNKIGSSDDQEKENAVPVEEELDPEVQTAQQQLKPFYSVPFNVSIEIGRSSLRMRDVLDLGYHSVVVLNKQAGSNLDILVNGVLMGRGEVVIVEDRAGIRINEIVDNRR
jgi:flagellar motor switch protein FliN/FliY